MAKKTKMSMRDRVRQKAQEKKDSGAFSSYLRFPDGKDRAMFKPKKEVHYLDVIPYAISDEMHPDVQSDLKVYKKDDPDRLKPGDLWHSRRFFVHKNVGSENKSYLCPLANQGKACPICEYSKQRKDQGAEYEELKEYRPKERWLLNVIDIKSEDKKVMVWDVSDFPFGQKLIKELTQEDEDYGNFAELEDGLTLKLRFENKKFGKNSYMEVDKLDFIERKGDYKESILDKVYDLDELLVYSSYATIESAFMMGAAPDEEDEDEDTAPRKSKSKKEREPELEVEEEDEQEEEEEEEPTPPRRTSKKKSKPEPEPEEDEDSEEEEEEEKPARTSRRTASKKEENKPTKKEEKTCPANGEFGTDFDKYEECDDCKYVKACLRASREDD